MCHRGCLKYSNTNNVATHVVAKRFSENVTKLDEAMDLADIVTGRKMREALNRDEKYRYYKNNFTPGEKHQFYQKNIRKKGQVLNLNFKYKWLADHPWHVYSKELSDGLCKACVLFDKSATNCGIFVKNVFQGVSKPEKITEHAGLHYNLAAMVEAERFIKGYEDPTTNVDFEKDKEERYSENLHVLKSIVQVVKLCAEQGLPLRGHRDNSTEEFMRDGNFMAIWKGFAKTDHVLYDHLSNNPKNAQMNSWKIQNEVIACIAEVVRRHIRYVLDNSKFFSVIADEVTDRYANK